MQGTTKILLPLTSALVFTHISEKSRYAAGANRTSSCSSNKTVQTTVRVKIFGLHFQTWSTLSE